MNSNSSDSIRRAARRAWDAIAGVAPRLADVAFGLAGMAVGLAAVAATLAPTPAAALALRSSDSLWVSMDAVSGTPVTSLNLAVGATRTLYLWIAVAPGAGYDLGGIDAPLACGAALTIGGAGTGFWTGSTYVPQGAAQDSGLAAYAPFAAWEARSLFDRSASDSSTVLALFAGTAGAAGFSGRAPVAAFTIRGRANGDEVLGDFGLPLADGTRRFVHLANSAGTRAWRPVVLPVTVHVGSAAAVGAGDVPASFALREVYPSPATAGAMLAFDAPEAARVDVRVFDVAGREVREAARTLRWAAGRHHEALDLSRMSAGVYLCRVIARAERDGARHEFTSRFIVVR